MFQVLGRVWALLLGLMLIMIGNGMQSTLMGVRGGIEGFSTSEMSVVTAGYFVGFLLGSFVAPKLIRKVGHVRVFAALGSLVSAALIAFPLLAEPWAWTLLRILVGFCISGIYVVSESWLNDAASNATRGKVLSAYMIAQTLGLITGQAALNLADAGGYVLFILSSILVSLSFAPILLSAAPVPVAGKVTPMSLMELYRRAPLGTVGTFFLGGVFAAQMGMAAVYGSAAGLSVGEVSIFVGAIFAGSLVAQYPVGWLSDRLDRRMLILALGLVGGGACMTGFARDDMLAVVFGAGAVMGGVASPLYSLLIAHANDHIETEDMPAAASGLVFLYGCGAVLGPLVAGQLMEIGGPGGFWLTLSGLFALLSLYTAVRMGRAPEAREEAGYVGLALSSSSVAIEAATEQQQQEASETEVVVEDAPRG